MFTVSALFQQYIVKPDRQIEIQAVIGGVLYTNGSVISFDIEDSIVPSEELSIGSVISSRLTISVSTTDAVVANAKITPSVRLNGASGLTEWIPLGDFYIDTRSFQNGVWKFVCFDRLMISNQPYVSTLVYPIAMQSVWNEIIGQLGLTSDASVVIDATYQIGYKPLDYSMRDILGYIASAHGANVSMAKDGKIKFVKLTGGVVVNISGADYVTADKTNTPKVVKKILLTYNTAGETLVAGAGTDAETLRIFNPFMTQAILDKIFTPLNGFTYTPFTMSWNGNPSVEVGDPILVTLRDTATIPSTILVNKMQFEGGLLTTSIAPSIADNRSETDYKVNLKTNLDKMIKEDVLMYYGVQIGRKFGIKIVRSDGSSQVILNSDGLEFTAGNKTIMINEWGFNPDFIKRFPNKIFNSGFEWYDKDTLVPLYWTGGGIVTQNANWEGTVSLQLKPTQFMEQGSLDANTPAGADPLWWNNLRTRISLKYKGGAIRVSVIKVTGSAAYVIYDNSDKVIVKNGTSLDYPAAANWENGYISFYFDPVVDGGRVRIRIENIDTTSFSYIDAVQMEPDFTKKWPSIYSAGPRSTPIGDIMGAPGQGGIYSGLDANRPSLNAGVIQTWNIVGAGLGYKFVDNTIFVVNLDNVIKVYNAPAGTLNTSWTIVPSSLNGCEIDGDNEDFLWLTGGNTFAYKYQISTKTQLNAFNLTSNTNGIASPKGAFVWVGLTAPDRIAKVNKADGVIVTTFPVTYTVSDIAWDGVYLWVGYVGYGKIQAFDPSTLKFVREITAPSTSIPGLTWDGKRLWAADDVNKVIVQLSEGTGSLPVLYYATDTKKIYWNVNNAWVFAGTTDHSLLAGLAADGHPQYMTDAEHDLLAKHPLGTIIPHDAFLGLTDTPKAYTGQTGKYLVVNPAGTGLDFTAGAAGNATSINSIPVDTAATTNGYVLTYDSALAKLVLKPKPVSGATPFIGTLARNWTRAISGVVVNLNVATQPTAK